MKNDDIYEMLESTFKADTLDTEHALNWILDKLKEARKETAQHIFGRLEFLWTECGELPPEEYQSLREQYLGKTLQAVIEEANKRKAKEEQPSINQVRKLNADIIDIVERSFGQKILCNIKSHCYQIQALCVEEFERRHE